MPKYNFKIELPINKCIHCPCIQFYPLEDEYMCGIAQMRMNEEDLEHKNFYCPLVEVVENE